VEYTDQKLCGRYLLKAIGVNSNYIYHYQDTTLEINPYQESGEYADLTLMNDEHTMIGDFQCKDDKSCTPKIFIKDMIDGNPQTLFEDGHGHFIGALSISQNDSLIAFSHTVPDTSGQSQVNRSQYISIFVLDIANKKIIYQTTTIKGSNQMLYVEKNSWDPTSTRFVFTNGRLQSYDSIDSLYSLPQGIFICDIKNDDLTFIGPYGYNAIWSNSGESIAYIRDDEIVLYHVYEKTSNIIYTEKRAENINSIHWNPCMVDELLIVSWHTTNQLFKTGHTLEQILNVETNTLIQRKSIAIGENSISWVR
jgi:hypothetical protein